MRLSGVTSSRWGMTYRASFLTSSGVAYARPSAAAWARTIRCRASTPRVTCRVTAPGGDGWRREVEEVALQRWSQVDAFERIRHGVDLGRGQYRGEVIGGFTGIAVRFEDLQLGCAIGVADLETHQEPVELRFGQGVGAFVLDRVLRGDHHEGRPNWCVTPSDVTCRSAIASRRADWVFGDARLISSASNTLLKPDQAGTRRCRSSVPDLTPVTSVGRRSG